MISRITLPSNSVKEEYTQTEFVADFTSVTIPGHFFIVTAHNPFGRKATDAENSKMSGILLERIKNSGWKHFSVIGKCADHAEAGYGLACTRAEAISLGKIFRQDAIYEVQNNQVLLVDCKGNEDDQCIGLWSELQAHTS